MAKSTNLATHDLSERITALYSRYRFAGDGREKEVSDATGLSDFDVSETVQHLKDENDPNVVIAKFLSTGQVPPGNLDQANYVDLVSLPGSYHEALNLVVQAQESFMSLSAQVRTLS